MLCYYFRLCTTSILSIHRLRKMEDYNLLDTTCMHVHLEALYNNDSVLMPKKKQQLPISVIY